jgi:hypothetical protein
MIKPARLLLAASVSLFLAATSQAEFLSYYIGIDDLPTIASGTSAGLANPNYNHLTFLYAHTYPETPASNHYHAKSIFTYTGPNLGTDTAVTNSASNFVPEGTAPPIQLTLGTSGIYAGKLLSNPYTDTAAPEYHFSFLEMGATDTLSGFAAGTGEDILFNSSAGRYNSSINLAHLHVEIVDLTPGLNVGSASMLNIGGVGSEIHLSDPGEAGGFSFTPVLWTNPDAAPGVYTASFRFFDEDGTFGDSGVVQIRTTVVPEPVTALTLGAGMATLGLLRRRRAVLA